MLFSLSDNTGLIWHGSAAIIYLGERRKGNQPDQTGVAAVPTKLNFCLMKGDIRQYRMIAGAQWFGKIIRELLAGWREIVRARTRSHVRAQLEAQAARQPVVVNNEFSAGV